MNYSNSLVSGIAMTPTYIVVGMWLGTYPVWIWVIGMIILLYLCSLVYFETVTKAVMLKKNPRKIYIGLFFLQISFYIFLLFVVRPYP